MKSDLETLCHLLQQLAAQSHFVQQLATEPPFVQQLLTRIQPGQMGGQRGGEAQVLLEADGDRHVRVHFGDGEAGAPLDAGFSVRLFAGPPARCELDGTLAVDVLIRPDAGEILYQGQLLSGGLQTMPEAREWRDGVVSYFRFDEAARQHLLIVAGASALLVQDWRNADLGIRLREASTVVSALAAELAVVEADDAEERQA